MEEKVPGNACQHSMSVHENQRDIEHEGSLGGAVVNVYALGNAVVNVSSGTQRGEGCCRTIGLHTQKE